MSENSFVSPDYLFEVSWEVCNKVGGIHTVIATKALNLSKDYKNHILIGPDVWRETAQNPEFTEDNQLLRAWKVKASQEGLRVRTGRWNVAGNPIVILVDYSQFISSKDEIFAGFWEKYGVDSLSGHWDYTESALFGYATGKVIESFVRYNLAPHQKAAAHFHEWMTGAGVLYLKSTDLPVATLFTTHATVTGRSIAGNNLPLYDNMLRYSPEEKAVEFNINAKHTLEKAAANEADVFTTVSDITAKECAHFLGREVDVVTPNGFENTFTPKEGEFKICSKTARRRLSEVAAAMTGQEIENDAVMIGISGRYEFKNKGIDIYLDALAELNNSDALEKEVIAWIFVPAWNNGPDKMTTPTHTSHQLYDRESDPVLKRISELFLLNKKSDKVKVLFVPTYLNGDDGVFGLTYYQLLCGLDLTVFPSYYEPWGYTPLESLAFGVQTITTTLAGFGLWVKEHSSDYHDAIEIIERDDNNYTYVTGEVLKRMLAVTKLSRDQMHDSRVKAKELSTIALWDNQIKYYKEAYALAVKKIVLRKGVFPVSQDPKDHISYRRDASNKPRWSRILIQKRVPPRLANLEVISRNLWWCWNQEATELFEMVDPELWRESEGNPIHMLEKISLQRYSQLEESNEFLEKLDRVYRSFSTYMAQKESESGNSVAYFSMEFGLDKSLKIYSGGLGVLAGDYLKEASDMMVPMTGIGLLYRYGYFTQKLSAQGDQIATYEPQDFTKLPVTPVRDSKGEWVTIGVALPGRTMTARLWRADVGRRELYLLDTDFEANLPEDRAVTHHLYGGDWENRLKQELLLGIGGIRALRALGINADVYHLNEGHAAFTGLERLREYVTEHNLTFAEATEVVRSSSLYTTHTPVPAGHDAFQEDLLRGYISHYPTRLKITWEVLMSLGKIDPSDHNEKFSMSNLAANLSQEINGVSKLHGKVSREILSELWPGYLPQELHVGYVTNGVHYPTWTAPEWKELHKKYFGEEFASHHYDKRCFEGIYRADNDTIWEIRNKLRRKVVSRIKKMLSLPSATLHYTPQQVIQIKEALRDDILTIGFARRFATYKRAHLLFSNLTKLESIVNNIECPVQFFFAGKAHPADKAGQDLIKRIVEVSLMPQFIGKILFVPGYDMTLAKYLVQGVDVWMNTPTRPLEASGTSGEKAVMNGVMHFSVLDGWWVEGYKEGAGWALPMENTYENQDFQNEYDAASIYNILENEIVPLFYKKRSSSGVPEAWTDMIKNTISRVASNFTTNRMLSDYIEQYYKKLAKRHCEMISDDFAQAREMALWKNRVRKEWPHIEVLSFVKPDDSKGDILVGEEHTAQVTLSIGGLSPEDIGVEIIVTENGLHGSPEIKRNIEFKLTECNGGIAVYNCSILADTAGAFNLAGRLFARNPKLPHRQDFDLVKWL
jgi:phosphorylase/glycogen(starch) synthase